MKGNALVASAGYILVALLSLVTGCATTGADTSSSLPVGTLKAPQSAEHADYLGISPGTETFVLEDINAEVVIVEIFDVYCRVCQKAAPGANALFELIQAGQHADRIKMLAVGTGNTQLEIDLFTKKFGTPFPSLPDPGKAFCKELGHTRTPEFVVMKRMPEGAFREIGRRVSYFTDADKILAWVLRRAGLD